MVTKACWMFRVFCSPLERAVSAGQQDERERRAANVANACSLIRLRHRGNEQHRTPNFDWYSYAFDLIWFHRFYHCLGPWLIALHSGLCFLFSTNIYSSTVS